MARASVQTLIPLDRFARIMGINPLHFNQVAAEVTPSTLCSMPITQYAWQDSDRVGREEIAFALREAENVFAQWLGFDVAPRWITQERVPIARQFNNRRSAFNSYWYYTSVQTSRGYVITGGQEAKTLIQAGAAVVYSDDDGDGYKETATISAATTTTNTDEIAIYYPGKDGANIWEVRPLISVAISAGVVTIKCRREQLALESLQEAFTAETIDGDNDANFLATVDIYRHYNDPSVQARFLWEDIDATGFPVQSGFLNIRDSRNGIVIPRAGTWVANNNDFTLTEWGECRYPDYVELWYKAGWENIPELERAICIYTTSLIDRPICGCDSLNHVSMYWREDLAETVSGKGSFQVGRRVLDNPLGTTRAAMEAWRTIERIRRYT